MLYIVGIDFFFNLCSQRLYGIAAWSTWYRIVDRLHCFYRNNCFSRKKLLKPGGGGGLPDWFPSVACLKCYCFFMYRGAHQNCVTCTTVERRRRRDLVQTMSILLSSFQPFNFIDMMTHSTAKTFFNKAVCVYISLVQTATVYPFKWSICHYNRFFVQPTSNRGTKQYPPMQGMP